MKFCVRCGQQLADAAKFCINCGLPCVEPPSAVADPKDSKVSSLQEHACADSVLQPIKAQTSKKKKKRIVLSVVFVAILVILVGAVLLLFGRIVTSPVKDFQYEISDGGIVITEYIGTDRKIRIPKKIEGRPVKVIGEEAFQGYDLIYVRIPDSVTTIENYAFYNCEQLEKVDFPKNLESINAYAFAECKSLQEIILPSGLQTIGHDAFYECTALKAVHFEEGLERIGENAFGNCKALERVHFKSGLKTIERQAFSSCENLSNVTLPDSLEWIGENAFGNCANLQYLEIPDNTKLVFNLQAVSGSTMGYRYTAYIFRSPVGGCTWYVGLPDDLNSLSDKPKLQNTVLIVKEGSYAHREAMKYSSYGIQFKTR